MRNFLKSLRSLVIILIATTAGAQTAVFDPYRTDIPPMEIAFARTCSGWHGDTGHGYHGQPAKITSDADAYNLCDYYSHDNVPDICHISGGKILDALKQYCKKNYDYAKSKLTNECQYISAYITGMDMAFAFSGTDCSGSENCKVRKCYFNDDGTFLPVGTGYCENGCTGGTLSCGGGTTDDIYGVKFMVQDEPTCHVHQADKKCESCYEDRADNSDDGHNYARDQIHNTDADDVKKQGGYILSQGCKAEAPNSSIGSVGSSSSIDISKIYSSISVSPISLLVPKCMVDPIPTTYPYVKFEHYDPLGGIYPQQTDVYNVIDKTHDDIVKGADNPVTPNKPRNPYKGNCGRGKFFYSNLAPKDSNITSQAKPDPNARITTNDIWESKTGCYNPEERFVILPPGQAKGGSDGKDNITFNEPNREIANPNTIGPAYLTGLSGDALTKYGATAAKALSPTADFSSAWDEAKSVADGGGIDPSTASPYLIPNDRILMRHPMCVKDYNGALFDKDGNPINPGDRRTNALRNATKPEDIDRIYKHGSLPVCMADNFLDAREGYCDHYFQRMYRTTKVPGTSVELPVSLAGNYTAQRYVFDTGSFCWKKDTTTLAPTFLAPVNNNHWMPLAIKGVMAPGTTTTTDIYGNTHTFHKTDYKRPTFTNYSERVITDSFKDTNPLEHQFQSLEEYGYREQPIPRTDYAYNPNNIYAPDSGHGISTEDMLKTENLGRKYHMQQCIGLLLEQYAFEGDKGAIVLDSDAQLVTESIGVVTSDASMCQWVAYYDTSENYGAEDWLKQRNLFKLTMFNFFSTVQQKNDDNGVVDINNKPLAITPINTSNPEHTQLSTINLLDPNRLQSGTMNKLDTSALGTSGTASFISGLGSAFFPDNMNDNGFRRRSGMRPEIFDYYNFLSFGAIGAYPEGYDLTNGTQVGDGNPYGETLEDLSALSSSLPTTGPLAPITNGMQNDLYSATVNNVLSPSPDSIGWQVNMERRNCRSVVPPQFWRDVIKPFQGCDFKQGSRMINDVNYSLGERNGPIGHLVSDAVGGIITGALSQLSPGVKHWMTTDVNTPILSLVTPVVGLPVVAYGLQMGPPYVKTNTESFEVQGHSSPVNLEDTWLSRAGGKAVMKTHLIESEWKLDKWAGLETPPHVNPTTDDKNDKIDTSNTNHPGYKGYEVGPSPWYGYDRYKEDPKEVNEQQLLGMVVMDEISHTSGREWIDHVFPARSCMHMDPMTITLPTDPSAISGLSSGISGVRSISDVIGLLGGMIDVNSLTHDALIDDTGAARALTTSTDGTRKYYSINTKSGANIGMVTDAWGTTDDIYVGTIPIFVQPTGSTISPDFDNKQMGGLTVFDTAGKFFEWLPSAWTVSVGINKAFWCEFEVPYNPYFTGDEDYMANKTPIKSNWLINSQALMVSSAPLKREYKPKLEYYRVERIRDSCGPFGVRSTWIDDPNSKLGEWLVGSKFGDETGDPTKHMGKSRCAGWLDLYKKGVTDPKIIAWRLPRFDYEFLKAFLDCTGPIRAVGPSPCEFNKAQFDLNQAAGACEVVKGIINAYITLPTAAYGLGEGSDEGKSIECKMNGGSGMPGGDVLSDMLGGALKSSMTDCLAKGCYKNSDDGTDDDNKWTPAMKIADNFIRAIDLFTRGDTYYGLNMPYKNSAGKLVNDDKILYALDGFREIEGQHKHSTQVEKYWLKKDDGSKYGENEAFGFWCNCPEDDTRTTRCREDFCTVEQHVLVVGRDLGSAGGQVIPDSVTKAVTPVAIAKAPGPFGRWLQCFYQARAKACPVLTREVSDTTAYSTITDPFQVDSKAQQASEFTSKGQNFNVCGSSSPTGLNEKQMSQFMRWSREEPNYLARLPVWFESSGDGYRHQDLMFYTQVRDFEGPYMEMAVPFPIDLVTRSQEPIGSGDCTYGHEYGTTKIKTGLEMIASGSLTNSNPCDKRRINALGEINQREGTGKIDYLNPAVSSLNPTPSTDPSVIHNEIGLINTYGAGFRSPQLLAKQNSAIIEPTVDSGVPHKYTDSTKYTDLYTRYLKGLYATAVSFGHQEMPIDPGAPGADVSFPATGPDGKTVNTNADPSKRYAISPRAEETIVGPRGCDIGGWYEMMLYQARCIKWFRLNCMCDYDKTFARGNSVNYALRRAGMKMKVAYPDYVDPKYKIEVSGAVSPDSDQKRDSKGNAIPQVGSTASNKVMAKIDFDVYGHPQILMANGIRARYDRISFPLADRGVLGPEFSPLTTADGFKIQCDKDNPGSGKTKDGKPCGLSQVYVGDIIIWDENISYKLSNGAFIDAGYPRHAAYVEYVNRNADTGAPISVTVKEMDWGKNLDSCGDTDMWGRETQRIIKKPSDDVTTSGTTPVIQTLPVTLPLDPSDSSYHKGVLTPTPVDSTVNREKGSTNSLASCQNADWAVCVEKFWDQVTIYRPYTLKLDSEKKLDSAVADPAYTSATCSPSDPNYPKILNEARIKEIAAAEGLPADVIAQGSTAISSYVFDQSNPVDATSGALLPSAAGYTKDDIMYHSQKWKLLVDPSEAAYPIDEVNKFLSNPLTGALDRCDPPVEARDNFTNVVRDVEGYNNFAP